MKGKFMTVILTLVVCLGLLLVPAAVSEQQGQVAAASDFTPIIFVHGGAGSGAQFESQAMRFASNGYPADYIFVLEYDSSFTINTMDDVWGKLDQLIATVKEKTGADQVDILGHSLGTTVMHGWLAFPARAANVAKYVNLDGRTAAALPGGVPTLALWATKGWSYNSTNTIVGATNVFIPNQTHVQVATSAESFVEMYKFFTGEDPVTKDIVPEPPGRVRLAGRAVFFPQNVGVLGATLEIWEVDGDTGARISHQPKATYSIGSDGAWGPFKANGLKHYEFVLLREDARPHHFYFEPFIRSDYLIRLLTSPTGGIGDLMERNDNSSALVIMRNMEFWGDQGVDNDVLTINGINIITNATCPLIKVPGFTGVIGIFAYDRYPNGITDLSAPIPTFFAVGFMTGVDIYIPAADPPNGTISLVLTPRGGGGNTQVINFPNWASSNHSVSIQFHDYLQDVIAFPRGLN